MKQSVPVSYSLNPEQPYLATPAQMGADYVSEANVLAKNLEFLFGKLVGSETDAQGKPYTIRTFDELEEISRAAEEIKEAIKKLGKDYGLDPFGDLILENTMKRYLGPFQKKYERVKEDIEERMEYQGKIAPYREKMRERLEDKRISDLGKIKGLGKGLFEFSLDG